MNDLEQKKIFSKNLNHYLTLYNKSQKEVADAISVSPQTFNTWCQGIALPRMGKVQRLSDYFHIEKSDLIDEHSPVTSAASNFTYASTPEEFETLVKPYRTLDSIGKEIVSFVLNKEAERMTEPESKPTSTVIDIQTHIGNNTRFIEYHHSASAGTGVFILGNEMVDQLPIPDTPENRKVDYAIKVSGNSMEPDYYDGDIVLVSQKVELNHGDVGIFIINNNAYIKEYGDTELISRNPNADNIKISEYDNIVCMGKVIGKYR